MEPRRLHQAPLALKIALSLFALVLGSGLLASQWLISQSLHGGDSWSWPGPESLRLKYAACPLERAILGSMGQFLDHPREAEPVLRWCRAGGERYGFYQHVAPVLNRRCLRCHGGESTRGDVDLSTWGDLAPLSLNRGPAVADLLRSTHLHLFGIGLLLLAMGGLLWRSRWPGWLRLGLPLLALAGLLLDIGGWWLARWAEAAVYVIFGGGFLMAAGLAAGLALALVDMWRPAPKTSAN